MSYQVLARKWRPQNFKEMVGQSHVLQALINALDGQRLHHAYLFTGTRGVGKTTIARIFAKCLNCETGITTEPCGTCESCRAITEGRFVDLIEVDAASRTRVDDTRELLDNVQYAPTSGRFKVYLIDEVHMLSGHSFNALLKTLEEPPEHVKFLFATTDPQKLPVTILSRCLQFNLKRMSSEMIGEHLVTLLDKESISYDSGAVKQLSKAADGSMRDGLSLLDQAIAFGHGAIKDDEVSEMLGTISHDWIYTLIRSAATGNGKQLLDTVEAMSGQITEFEAVADTLISILHQIAVVQAVPDITPEDEHLAQLAKDLAMEDVQLYYQIALNARRDLPLSPDPRAGFEMLLLRLMAFRPEKISPRQAVVPTQNEAQQPTENTSASDPVALPIADEKKKITPSENEPPPWVTDDIPAQTRLPSQSSNVNQSTDSESVPPKSKPQNAEEPQSAPMTLTNTAVEDDKGWYDILQKLDVNGRTTQLARHCILVAYNKRQDNDAIELHLDESGIYLHSDSAEQALKQALEDWSGKAISLSIKTNQLERETPAMRDERESIEKQQRIERNIQKDPFVRDLQTQLGAQIVPGSIRSKE